MTRPGGNPFATCRVRPGAIPFVFIACQESKARDQYVVGWVESSRPSTARAVGLEDSTHPTTTTPTIPDITFLTADSEGQSAARLVERLRAAGWRGQIVGPHGTGKSTLLAALRPFLDGAGCESLWVVRHQGERALPRAVLDALRRARREGRHRLLVIDGYEQLGWWSAWQVRRLCRRGGHGLLVTAHGDVALPTLYRTAVGPAAALRVVSHLTAGTEPTVTETDVKECLAARAGNLREALFDLYDLHEQRRGGILPLGRKAPGASDRPDPEGRPCRFRTGRASILESFTTSTTPGLPKSSVS